MKFLMRDMLHAVLIATLAAPASAFWRMPCPGRLLDARMDPIIAPGKISNHIHSISGASGFGLSTSYKQLRGSKCSSCPITADLSAYWTPKLYVHAKNGSFVEVPQAGDNNGQPGGMTVYYLQRPGPNKDKLHAFPEGFRMISGDPFKRNDTGDFASQAISFACLDYNGPPSKETNNLPDRNCPDGVRVQVFFPACWDGKNVDSPDHQSHMSFPSSGAYNDGACPPTHPVHMVSIFYEVIYQTNLFTSEWNGNQQPFVLGQGDPTGYGFHGDFVNGWDVPTLQSAVDDCTNDSGDMKQCNHFTFFEDDQCHQCQLTSPFKEPVSNIPALPGCNPVRPGPEYAPPVEDCPSGGGTNGEHSPPTAAGGAAPPAPAPSTGPGESSPSGAPPAPSYAPPAPSQDQSFADLTHKGYRYLGCAQDDYYTRTLTGPTTNDRSSQSGQDCLTFCSQHGTFTYFGTEYGSECYCGNDQIPDSKMPIPGIKGNCNMKCSGSEGETCGGSAALSLYEKCAEGQPCVNAATTSPAKRDEHLRKHKRHGHTSKPWT